MIRTFDRYIFWRMLVLSCFVTGLLIFIFIIIDFSDNSGDFTDRGATFGEILLDYYRNYIPEMIRLVSPVAVFASCLWITGQMARRLEIVALRAAGISLYRLMIPYVVFASMVAALVSYLDGYVVPQANAVRAEFEQRYILNRSERLDRNRLFRQNTPNSLLLINYYDVRERVAYRVTFYDFEDQELVRETQVGRMSWQEEEQVWRMFHVATRQFHSDGYHEFSVSEQDTVLNLYPRDFGRTSSDVYQLTYPEIRNYIASIERSGAGGIEMPRVQYYGKLSYPFSIVIVTIIGVAIASVRRRGGPGVYIASGLVISFLYLAFMKLAEPFGYSGVMDPMMAALLPHGLFFAVAMVLLITARK